MGLGKGNGAAPLGFLAVCTLMINVYHNLGHGVTFIEAWAQGAFTLATVLYVDDSDLFHMAIGMPLDEEFLELVQNATATGQDWFTRQGGCSNHRNASGSCLVGYGRRQVTPQDPFWAATGPTLHTSAGWYKGSDMSEGHH